jgi:hypothetical protein
MIMRWVEHVEGREASLMPRSQTVKTCVLSEDLGIHGRILRTEYGRMWTG